MKGINTERHVTDQQFFSVILTNKDWNDKVVTLTENNPLMLSLCLSVLNIFTFDLELFFPLQKLINMHIYDNTLYANLEDLNA